MWVHMQVESLAIDIEDGSGRKKKWRKKICLASFAERLLQMLNLSKKVQQEKMAWKFN